MIGLKNISKSYGDLKVLTDFSVEFPPDRITAILGPSGCGKTTILNLLAGLTGCDRGEVATEAQVSYLFQEPRLLPWLTVWENVAFVLRDKVTAAVLKKEVDHSLAATGLIDYSGFYPSQLSGGMRQRVAMARAFCFPAPLLLMDEPLNSLDYKTKFQLMADFLTIWANQPRTVVLVTHDLREAITMAHQIIILSAGPTRLLQIFPNEPRISSILCSTGLFPNEDRILELLLKN